MASDPREGQVTGSCGREIQAASVGGSPDVLIGGTEVLMLVQTTLQRHAVRDALPHEGDWATGSALNSLV